MKSYFKRIAELAQEQAAMAAIKYPSLQDAFNKTSAAATAAAKSAKEGFDSAVEKSGEMLQDAVKHDYTQVAVAKAKDLAAVATAELQRVTSQRSGSTDKSAEEILGTSKSSTPAEDIEKAIAKLESSDKVGRAGEAIGVIGGVAAGASAAGVVAAAAGATTILGSTTLGAALGGVFVAATPVGWVLGTAAVAGAAGYGIAKMIRSGSQQDVARREIAERLRARLESLRVEKTESSDLDEFRVALLQALESGMVTEEQAEKMTGLVEKGVLNSATALSRIRGIIASASVVPQNK